ncbi:flavin reductase family protein [Gilvibacter sp.]|uniref:flavin reductase family protein n=1 Tax=Gilvibacter sp. TaxID=2729997 RepID=UPI0025BEBCFB|nr:flavin reductase family protein [Gilvibacter sp.]NQX78707.1 flavin reductase family protein [Gilvibacter sp.]
MKTQYTHNDITEMDRIKRLHLINSITGVKPANLIGTVSSDGQENLAIFSSVVHLGSNPPFLGFVLRPHFEFRRDTYNNLEQSGYYTINHVPAAHTEQAHYTSAKFDEGESEFERCGFTPEYLGNFPAPFVKESPVKIGLKKVNEIPIPQNGTLFVIGRIELIEVPEWVDEANGKLNLEKLAIAGISGLNTYYKMTEVGDYPYARVADLPDFKKNQ